jgi:hypothetical protein
VNQKYKKTTLRIAQQSQAHAFGGGVTSKICSLTTSVALPTELGSDGQRPILITKGNPTSSRGCYKVSSVTKRPTDFNLTEAQSVAVDVAGAKVTHYEMHPE